MVRCAEKKMKGKSGGNEIKGEKTKVPSVTYILDFC